MIGIVLNVHHQHRYSRGMFVIVSFKSDSSKRYHFTVDVPVMRNDRIEIDQLRTGGTYKTYQYVSAKRASVVKRANPIFRNLPELSTTETSPVREWASGLHVKLTKLEEEGIARIWPLNRQSILKLAHARNLQSQTGKELLYACGASEREIQIFHLASCIMAVGDGHIVYSKCDVISRIDSCDSEDIVHEALSHDILTQPRPGFLALTHLYQAEVGIARMIQKRMRDAPAKSVAYASDQNDKLSNEQWNAIRMALSEPVCVWTGPPGSGKTTALSALASLTQPTLFLAPTGKAVSRMRELVRSDTLPMTIHRWLHRSDMPNHVKLVVVDETSMMDVETFHSLLEKLDPDAHLLLVGDADQLPSVGPGNVLRDLIDSGIVPHTALTNVFRQQQGSKLADAIQTIRANGFPDSDAGVAATDADFWIENITHRYRLRDRMCELVRQYTHDDGTGVMVVTFKNKDVDFFGEPFRSSHGHSKWGMHFRIGDRVMQSKNVYSGVAERMNGEVGKVVEVREVSDNERIVNIVFDVDKRVEEYHDDLYGDQETYDQLVMAMPITVHKAQGSQAETVIYVIPDENFYEHRNLVYTAISRAEKRCIVLGRKNAFWSALDRSAAQRRTMLAELLVKIR
jgi:hypothetical protein